MKKTLPPSFLLLPTAVVCAANGSRIDKMPVYASSGTK